MIDLRSDTVTKPTPVMRRAMADAEVGDDVYGEDPTVHRLEAEGARMMGKEAGLFVPTGTMANLLAAMTHLRPGQELFAEAEAHILYYEQGGCARIAGAMPHPIPGKAGRLTGDDVRAHVRPQDIHFPRPGLLALENTHNRSGGEVWTVEETRSATEAARALDLALHLDGARIFNAARALEVLPDALAREFDSISFCLSKGLGAPVGSLLVGKKDFIAEARRNRKVVGGGMRQAGVIAAAGLVALREMVERLDEDHAHARRLATGLAEVDGLSVLPARIRTNMVMVDVPGDAPQWVRSLKEKGILVNATGPRRIRLVTHVDVSAEDMESTIDAFKDLVREGAA